MDPGPPTRSRGRRVVVLELAAVGLTLHLGFLALFRHYPPPLSWMPDSFLGGGALLLVVVWLRTRSEYRRVELAWRERLLPGRWLSGIGMPGIILLAGFVGVFYGLEEHGGRVGNDGEMLYVYVRSLVIDHDLDLTNEFDEFVQQKFQYIARQARKDGESPDPGNEIGPVVFWLPFFLLAHWLVIAGGWLGGSIPADGYSYPYINAVCLGSLVWAFVGVVVSYRIASRWFSPTLAALGAVALWLASPLFWYTVYEPSMSHAVSTAAVALFVWSWIRVEEHPGARRWAWLGVSAALMLSVQRYNLFYLLLPASTLVRYTGRDAGVREPGSRKRLGRRLAWAVAALGAVTAPLWIYNLLVHGRLLREGDLPATAIMYWRHPFFFEFLFSSNHGLFAWTPAAYLAAIGLAVLAIRRSPRTGILLATLVCGVYLLSSTWDWYSGYSFSSRRLTEAYPLFLVGFCGFLSWAVASPRIVLGIGVALLAGWNIQLAEQLKSGDLPAMDTFSFAKAAQRGVEDTYRRIGHPPSIPANWVFARLYGVSPDRFDTVFGHRAYNNLTIDVGEEGDVYFLGRGWSIPERDSSGVSFRWSEGPSSSWLVSLFDPYDYHLSLRGGIARHPERDRQSVGLEVNGERVAVLSWRRDESEVETVVPRRFWRSGLNEIVLRYGYTVPGGEIYGGADPRLLGIRLARLELQIEK